MGLKDTISKFYFFPKLHIKDVRNRIENKDFTLLASNCMGGLIYHNLGLQFKSPTINLQICSNQFADFILNLDEYLKKDIEFIEPDNGVPVGKLGDMTIHFTHYKTNEEALEKWNKRKSRINYDNLYILLNDMDGITEEQIRALGNVKCKNMCIFTAKEYPDLPYTLYLPEFKNQECIGNIMKKSRLTGLRGFESKFDYVSWLNSTKEDGLNYRK
ncbi:DUF1919 domain-containing protein [uncultured Eubacterium sp.]|uniref:DUF1919 domain-containing protein n=1 Tax=uncultured Eubacterium sp. TaxID=165185 RepID=UPI0025E12530|nr:DUF1919 domain-containing protein [uncultured Eubacterium sp.]